MKKQIIVIFVATILLTGLLSIFLFVRREKDIGVHWLTENSRSQLDLMGDLLNSDLEKMKGQLGRVATLMEAGQTEEAQKALGAFVGVAAQETASSNILWKVGATVAAGQPKDEWAAEWTQKLLKAGGEATGIQFYATQLPEGEIRSGLSIPASVKDRRTGQVNQVRLVGILPRAMFQELIDKLKIQGVHVFLTTEAGLTLAHTVSEYLGNTMVGDRTFDEIRRQKSTFGSIKTKDFRGDDILSFFVKLPVSKLVLVSQWRKDLWVMTDWVYYGQAIFIVLALALLGGGLALHSLRKMEQGEVVIREVPVERIVERVVEKVVEKQVVAQTEKGREGVSEKAAPSPLPMAPSLPPRPFSLFNTPTVPKGGSEPVVSMNIVDKVVASLKAPLLSVLGHVQIARLNPQGGSLQAIETEVRNARDVLERLGQFSGQAQVPSVTVPLYEVVEAALRTVEGAVLRGGIKIVREIPPDLGVKCDIDELKTALGAIFRNSVEAMEKVLRKNLTLRAQNQNGTIVFEIEDTGEGILPENIQKVFEPFFTTRSALEHRGLGLAMAQGILRQHLADVSVQSRLGEGTCLTIKIPLSTEVMQSLSERGMSTRPLREVKTPSLEALTASTIPAEELTLLSGPLMGGAGSGLATPKSAPMPTNPPSFTRETTKEAESALANLSSETNVMSFLDEDDDSFGDFQFGRIDFAENKGVEEQGESRADAERSLLGGDSLASDLSRGEQMALEVMRSMEAQPSSSSVTPSASPVKRLKKKEEPLASMKVQIPRPEERL